MIGSASDALLARPRCGGGISRLASSLSNEKEIQLAVPPLQDFDRIVAMIFDLLHQIALERFGGAGDAECPIIHIAPGLSGDLAG